MQTMIWARDCATSGLRLLNRRPSMEAAFHRSPPTVNRVTRTDKTACAIEARIFPPLYHVSARSLSVADCRDFLDPVSDVFEDTLVWRGKNTSDSASTSPRDCYAMRQFGRYLRNSGQATLLLNTSENCLRLMLIRNARISGYT
jgi:hypothetical protein